MIAVLRSRRIASLLRRLLLAETPSVAGARHGRIQVAPSCHPSVDFSCKAMGAGNYRDRLETTAKKPVAGRDSDVSKIADSYRRCRAAAAECIRFYVRDGPDYCP